MKQRPSRLCHEITTLSQEGSSSYAVLSDELKAHLKACSHCRRAYISVQAFRDLNRYFQSELPSSEQIGQVVEDYTVEAGTPTGDHPVPPSPAEAATSGGASAARQPAHTSGDAQTVAPAPRQLARLCRIGPRLWFDVAHAHLLLQAGASLRPIRLTCAEALLLKTLLEWEDSWIGEERLVGLLAKLVISREQLSQAWVRLQHLVGRRGILALSYDRERGYHLARSPVAADFSQSGRVPAAKVAHFAHIEGARSAVYACADGMVSQVRASADTPSATTGQQTDISGFSARAPTRAVGSPRADKPTQPHGGSISSNAYRAYYASAIPSHAADELDHSPSVQRMLDAAAARLRAAPRGLDSYAAAERCLDRCIAHTMSARQRMRVLFLLGLCFSARGDYQNGIGFTEEALSLAFRLNDLTTIAYSAYHLGAICRATSRINDAAQYYQHCLQVLEHVESSDVDFHCDVSTQLALIEAIMAHWEAAERLLEYAERLCLDGLFISPLRRGLIYWGRALVSRWQNQPLESLQYAELTCDLFAPSGQPHHLARAQSLAGDIALDVVSLLPRDSTMYGEYLHTAMLYISHVPLSTQVNVDPAGAGLATLASARLLRLSGENHNRLSILMGVVQFAETLNDGPLLGQAFAAMGDELASTGELGSARNMYIRALDVLRDTRFDAMLRLTHQKLVALSDEESARS